MLAYSQTTKIGFLARGRNIFGKASDELNSYVLLITPIVIMKKNIDILIDITRMGKPCHLHSTLNSLPIG